MTPSAASFRDPSGSCRLFDGRILRVVQGEFTLILQDFLKTECARSCIDQRRLVPSRLLPANEVAALDQFADWRRLFPAVSSSSVFEHERIPFASFPYEWPPEMLYEAGRLTLELASGCIGEGYGLKDATPYNVLFRGSDAVFIDVTSFERRAATDPVWNPYGQFVRTFLLPLLVNQRWGLPLSELLLTHRDGLEPQDVYRLCGYLDRFKPRFFSLVSMPTWLKGKAAGEGRELYRGRDLKDEEKARFILESILKQLGRLLEAVKPAARKSSVWSDYMETHSYTRNAFSAKEQFIDWALREFKPRRTLDIGANTGYFSELAARSGAEVVSIDIDPACIGSIWSSAHAKKLNVLPLVVDIARPTPAIGWKNSECPSFLDRARGRFDSVLMLAVLHHLLVTERIPLHEILQMASELTTDLLILEYVGPEDQMFRTLTRGRDELYTFLNREFFENACLAFFDIVKSVPVPEAHRQIYCLKRKKIQS